ncbi:MAG: hypothetical protein AB1418_12335 [Pseudomonadota bacterium]
MTASLLVRVGAVGWQHATWRGPFYPEDMPEDWMLSYYNTQFSAVYLPAECWQTASPDAWAQWLYDTRDDFHFILAPGDPGVAPPASERVWVADADWVAAHLWWLDDAPDLRALSQRIARQAASGEPLYVISRGGDLARMHEADTLRQVMGY